MAKRRVKSNPYAPETNVNQADLLTSLGGLANVSDLLLDEQGISGDNPLKGTSQQEYDQQDVRFPNVPVLPYQQDVEEDLEGENIPEGLALLGDLAGAEAEEDALDAVSETDPYNYLKDDPFQKNARAFGIPRLREDAFLKEGEERSGYGTDILNAISDYFNPEEREKQSELNKEMVQKAQKSYDQQGIEEAPIQQQQIDEAVKNPYTKVVYGATDTVFNSPQLREEVERIGIPINPEVQRLTKDMEAALSEMDERELKAQGGWNQQVKEIRERIDSNKASQMDKYAIGLALLMPLVVGGIFGLEAGVGTLAGTAKALSGGMQDIQKGIKEDEKTLANLNKEISASEEKRQKIGLEKLKIPETVNKITGDSPYSHLQGMNLITYTDPEGNQVQGVRFKPGIVADIEFLEDKDAKKEMRKEAQEVNKNRSAVNKLGDNARKIVEIASQMDDQNMLSNIFQNWALGKKPSLVAKFGKEITLDGRKVNSAVALTQLLEDTMEQRRQVQKIKNFGPQLFEHFARILTNPYGEFTSPQDLIDQVLRLYTDTRDQFLDASERSGFLRQPLIEDFYDKDRNMYERLNLKEDLGESNKLLKKLMVEDAK